MVLLVPFLKRIKTENHWTLKNTFNNIFNPKNNIL